MPFITGNNKKMINKEEIGGGDGMPRPCLLGVSAAVLACIIEFCIGTLEYIDSEESTEELEEQGIFWATPGGPGPRNAFAVHWAEGYYPLVFSCKFLYTFVRGMSCFPEMEKKARPMLALYHKAERLARLLDFYCEKERVIKTCGFGIKIKGNNNSMTQEDVKAFWLNFPDVDLSKVVFCSNVSGYDYWQARESAKRGGGRTDVDIPRANKTIDSLNRQIIKYHPGNYKCYHCRCAIR